ncbi:hypothetical protein [Pseudomonas viridiflava]|uniref:hypothetical protein n=1 Tax=Pseudomonas viridiflava TaxID=33069 RepID=UPI000F0435D0|nr:hypothetical protein [Pseudomonas viridiflava]MEE4129135.1 hypothetical protein [Pseudomonas viridiflava]
MTAAKLSAEDQYRIEVMLTRWKGKLTWGILTDKLEFELGICITRQALCTYIGISEKFKIAKRELRVPELRDKKALKISECKLLDQIEDLKAQVAVLRSNNAAQLRMIERILTNASTLPNLDLRDLIRTRPEEI